MSAVPNGSAPLSPLAARGARVPATDTIDLAELAGALRRRRSWIAAATVLGLVAAVAIVLLWPPRFQGQASIVLRSANDQGSSLLSRLGVPAELAPAGLGAAMKSPMETELQLLGSRAVLGTVSDSLGLQARVLAPRGTPPWRLLQPRPYPGSFRKVTLTFARSGAGYRVTGRDVDGTLAPGATLATPYGPLTLAAGTLPDRFEVQLLDREDAMERLLERVSVEKAGGEVARISYAGADSLSAAAVPDAIVAVYLQRRRTTDRGVNEHRVEFLSAQADSVRQQLVEAERALRAYQEGSGVVDPELLGKLDLEGASRVRELLAANQVESTALESMLRGVAAGTLTARQLAAYPSFLKSPAVNEILGQLAKLETERTALLERRTEADPEVVALTTSVRNLEQQLQPLGTAYAQALGRQRGELQSQAARFDASIATLPGAAQEFGRRSREVKRLAQTALAVQTQLLDARLAAIGEGGEVRQLDAALVPKRPVFPRPRVVLPLGLGLGLLAGLVAALAASFFSPLLGSAAEAGRLLGVPAARLGEPSPLFHALVRQHEGAVAVLPLDDAALGAAAADWLAPARAEALAPSRTGRELAAVHAGGGAVGAPYAPPNGRAVAGMTTLAPLAGPDGVAQLVPGLPVVLVLRAGTARVAAEEAAAAVRLGGGQLVACVVG